MITPKIKNEGRTVTLGPCRLSYTHLFKKFIPESGGEGKYMTVFLIPKTETETIKAIESAIEAAKKAGVKRVWEGKLPKELATPLRDGDEKENDPERVFAGHWYINAKCNTRPGVVDKNCSPIMDEEEIYSGVWAVLSVSFFPYKASGNRGVACGLNNVMKVRDGDHLGGRSSAASDFAGVSFADEDDDDL